MYNRYLNSQNRDAGPEAAEKAPERAALPEEQHRHSPRGSGAVRPGPAVSPGSLGEGLRQLKGLLGEGAELGDLLLILILLLLYLEKEDEEILIILSALVVMGFR